MEVHVERERASKALSGWGEMMRQLRSKLAVTLLSSPRLSVADVALAVGYSRPEAMTNAFQRDGLPPPLVVRERLLQVHADKH